jgi:hypothetical protein
MDKLMKREERTVLQELQGTVDEIIAQLKKLIREGNARRLIIKNKEGKILFQSHLTIGVAGTAFAFAVAPIISAITMFVMYVNDVSVIVERETDPNEDEYEVEADIIEINEEDDSEDGEGDGDDNETAKAKKKNQENDDNDESGKTVGKE